MLDQQLNFILKGGRTRRYHTHATIRDQNVAEHSFFVAWLIVLMYGNQDENLLLIYKALFHDIAEGAVGDVASPVKRANLELASLLKHAEENALLDVGLYEPMLTAEQNRMLKMADNMEGLLHCADELRRGNVDALEVYNNFHAYIVDQAPTGKELVMLNYIERRRVCPT